jgi:hypothetical protein
MPGAGRTREPCVQRKVHFAHASNDRAAETSDIPCAMVLTPIARSPRRPGFFASVTRRHVYTLDPSVGGSGPHALAVHDHAVRHATRPRPPHSTPTFVTVATPLIARMEQNENIVL